MEIEAPTAAKMVEPPVNDIYLCDYCGADFSSLSAIKVNYFCKNLKFKVNYFVCIKIQLASIYVLHYDLSYNLFLNIFSIIEGP